MRNKEESGLMYRRLKNKNSPAYMILRHIHTCIVMDEWGKWPNSDITDAVMCIDICISRVNSEVYDRQFYRGGNVNGK